jgi:sulfate adenylyltransferase subunit 2
MADDDRLPAELKAGVHPQWVRFRTLGCYPLTGATPSRADSLDAVISEISAAAHSEREGRTIDRDPGQSMERKKQEGYF